MIGLFAVSIILFIEGIILLSIGDVFLALICIILGVGCFIKAKNKYNSKADNNDLTYDSQSESMDIDSQINIFEEKNIEEAVKDINDNELKDLLKNGKRPEAIKKAREMSGMDLTTAMIYVDNLNPISNSIFDTSSIKIRDSHTDECLEAAKGKIASGEKVLVALKGGAKEYLICTDSTVYIIKEGFLTGHTLGTGSFKMSYKNITNAEVDFNVMSGYFELSSGGLENRRLNFNGNKNNDPQHAPNAVSIVGGYQLELFESAASFIMKKVTEDCSNLSTTEKSVAEQIREFKSLLDEGIITQEEFDAKKNQLLNL